MARENLSHFYRIFQTKKCFLLPKLFLPIVRKECSSDREKLFKFEAEDQEFSKILRSLEQFIQTSFGNRMLF